MRDVALGMNVKFYKLVTQHILVTVILNHQKRSLKGLMFGTTLSKLIKMEKKCVSV
ncbi:hypothetical protein MtrunA17_Chr8g0383201 [Medicago truncatula]|uniref:Uncharacterized protein n=1 Tax=Medicago truncatula TaxID=3880 RepID=A0A396GPN8_MEDTR|nr:hypothetical protein MtrunA17_Chr8g0383201 [Medicago truncatula]